MRVVYALEPYPTEVERTIFLAGPTPRAEDVPSWRPEAMRLLEEKGWEGTVFVPEPRDGKFRPAYDDQIEWELEGLRRADCIVFWIPRDLETLPGFTTNVEFGTWASSRRVILGAPTDAPKLRYLRAIAHRLGVPEASSLEGTVERAIDQVGEGAPRKGAECQLPAGVFRSPVFQSWLTAQRAAGNIIERLSLEWSLHTGPRRDFLFLWVVHAAVYVSKEGRTKKNEVIVGRPDVAAVVLYRKREPLERSELVLVREFRAPASNADAYVHEHAGGSAFDATLPWVEVARSEVEEEVGLHLAIERLRAIGSRQIAATLSAHRAHAFAAEISEEELAVLKRATEPRGEGGTERTFVEIWAFEELLADERVDWSTLGLAIRAISPPRDPE
jgi:hypothetical protein